MSSILPPKKNWKEGNWQIGLSIRLPDSSIVESVWDDAPKHVREKAVQLLLERFPEAKKIVEDSRAKKKR